MKTIRPFCPVGFSLLGSIAACLVLAPWSHAQLQPNWKELGRLETRHARDIKASTWSVGGETLDRDFADYQAYKSYLGPLGAKRIRLQAGWAKCEKTKGRYDFGWLDAIVFDASAQGVSPWLELAYGNPIYDGGGEPMLGGALPTSEEALAAWDNWVRAIVVRYRDHVNEWEVWNEPDHGKGITGESYAHFYLRTGRLIRTLQPEAKLLGVALASLKKIRFVTAFCEVLKRENAFNYLDLFVYHGYFAAYGLAYNPDDIYPQVEAVRQLVWSYDPRVIFFQGESGAPSLPNPLSGVFKDYDWTELSQAKWNLRRMLGDHGRGIATSVFSISDMHYGWGTPALRVNPKGLLKTNPDKTIDRPKLAYRAVQHVFSLFDERISRKHDVAAESDRINQSLFCYQQADSGLSLITVWQAEYPPYDQYESKTSKITVTGGHFEVPVLVDTITGKIFGIPETQWQRHGNKHVFSGIPIPDYPIILTDRRVVLKP